MNKNAKNVEEFKVLVERYETITLKEIIRKVINPYLLTGFGSISTCTLCVRVGRKKTDICMPKCSACVYYSKRRVEYFSCNSGQNGKTYWEIHKAHSPEQLLKAYRDRAAYLRKHYVGYFK